MGSLLGGDMGREDILGHDWAMITAWQGEGEEPGLAPCDRPLR